MKAIKFLRESFLEAKLMKKPSKKELLKNTYIVCIFCIFSSLIIWGMDTSIRYIMQLILR